MTILAVRPCLLCNMDGKCGRLPCADMRPTLMFDKDVHAFLSCGDVCLKMQVPLENSIQEGQSRWQRMEYRERPSRKRRRRTCVRKESKNHRMNVRLMGVSVMIVSIIGEEAAQTEVNVVG